MSKEIKPYTFIRVQINQSIATKIGLDVNERNILAGFHCYLTTCTNLKKSSVDSDMYWINLENFFYLIQNFIDIKSYNGFTRKVRNLVSDGYLESLSEKERLGSGLCTMTYFKLTNKAKQIFQEGDVDRINNSKPDFSLNNKSKEKPAKKLPKKQQMCIDLGFSQELTDKIMAYKGNHNVDTMRRHFSEMTVQEVEKVVDLNLNYNQGKQTYGFKYEWNQPSNNYSKSSKISYQEVSSGRCTVIDDEEDW